MNVISPITVENNQHIETTPITQVIEIDVHTAFQWMQSGTANLLDVREAHEYAVEKIDGADFFPLSQFEADKIKQPTDNKLIVFCAVGKRSIDAGERLIKSGHSVAYSMKGGLIAWDDAGYPIQE